MTTDFRADRALHHAFGPVYARRHVSTHILLAAILDDPSCGAVSYLNGCGVDVVTLRQAVRSGQAPAVEDAVPLELRSTRDALVGRRRYKPRGLGQFWTTLLVRVMPMNAAAHPVL